MTAFQSAQLGDRVKDPITNFTGIVNSVTTWLHGCIRMGVQPEKLDKDGKVKAEVYFDQSQLVVAKKAAHKPVVLATAQPERIERRSQGGPAREGRGFSR